MMDYAKNVDNGGYIEIIIPYLNRELDIKIDFLNKTIDDNVQLT